MRSTITAIASLMALSASGRTTSSGEELSRWQLYNLFQSMPIILFGSEDCNSNHASSDNIVLTEDFTFLDQENFNERFGSDTIPATKIQSAMLPLGTYVEILEEYGELENQIILAGDMDQETGSVKCHKIDSAFFDIGEQYEDFKWTLTAVHIEPSSYH